MRKDTLQALIFMLVLAILIGAPMFMFEHRFGGVATLPLTDEDYETMPTLEPEVKEEPDQKAVARMAEVEIDALKDYGILADDLDFSPSDVNQISLDEARQLGAEYGNRKLGDTYLINASNEKYSYNIHLGEQTHH